MLSRWFTRWSRSARKPASARRPARQARPSLGVEQFEDRMVLSPLIGVSNHRDLVYDPYRNFLYITTSNGFVQTYNLNTQSLMAPVFLGGNLTSADITNDGNTLVVADQQTAGSQMVLHRLNLNTLAVSNLYYPSGPGEGGWGLALGPGTKGLMTDLVPNNNPGPMRQFDLATGQEVFRYDDPGSGGGGGVGSGTVIHHSADRSLFLITEGTVPYGPLFTYSSQTDTFSRQPYMTGVNLTGALTAVNRNGTLFAITANGTTTVYNSSTFRMVAQFPGMDGGVAFDPSSDTLYALSSSNGQITAFDTNSWTYKFSQPVGEAVPRGTALGNGVMTVSNDGRWLFVATPTGVREVPLPGTGPAVMFSVSNWPSVATAGTPFTFTLSATDSYGHVATGYVGTVHFVSTDPQAVLPPDYTFLSSDLGTHTFTVTLKTAGKQSVNLYDTRAGFGIGPPPTAQVIPGALASFQLTTSGATNPQPAGYPFGVLVTAYDAYGNLAYNYAGKVHFTSTDPSAQLPPDYTFAGSDQGRHGFSVTLNKVGSQTVTATDTAKVVPPATPPKGSVTLSVLNYIPGLYFKFTTATSTPTAGAPFGLTVTAYDKYNQVAKLYTGTITFTTSDKGSGVALPADYTFTAADAGVHTFTNGATLVTAGAQTIALYDPAYSSSAGGNAGGGNGLGGATYTTAKVTVIPAAATTLRLGGFPTSLTAGGSGTFTVTAYDPYGNVATGYAGTLHFTSTDAQAVLPADATLTNGTGTFSATLETAGTQGLTATDTVNTALSGSQSGITVAPAAASTFAVAGFPTPVTAGTAAAFTVTALDPYGNVATGYAGTVHFTSSDAQAVLPADATLTNGTGTFSATLDTAGAQSLTATDTADTALSGSQSGITVSPAAASVLVLSAPSTVSAGVPFTLTVTLLDAYGNVATGYAGTVHFSSSDALAGLPADYTFTAADAGTHSFSATLWTVGSQDFTATDDAGLSGTLAIMVS
jgi:WD40 repeat protein